MRNGMLFLLLAGLIALAGCNDTHTAIENLDDGLLAQPCLSENRGTFILHNGKDAPINALVDDRFVGSLEAADDLEVNVSAGIEHEVRFDWIAGSIACFASHHTVEACESLTISCD